MFFYLFVMLFCCNSAVDPLFLDPCSDIVSLGRPRRAAYVVAHTARMRSQGPTEPLQSTESAAGAGASVKATNTSLVPQHP